MPQGSVLGLLLLLTFLVLLQGSLLSLRFEHAITFQHEPKRKAHKNYVPAKMGPTAVIHRLQSIDLPPHCHIAANISASKLLKDESGNFYLYNQYAKDRFKDDPCSKQKRFKRQSEIENRIKQANVEVQSLDLNVSISQLINITSGKSTVDIREDFVKININSDQSHIRIIPEKSHVNITVKQPFVVVNVSEEDGFELSTGQSEMFIHSKRVNQEAYIMMQSGKSNMNVRSGLAEVFASNADISNVMIQTWFADIKPRMVISSNVTRPDGRKGKTLGILLLTKMSRTEINLISASVRIKYGKIDLRISEDDHTITIFSGVYTVRIATVTSPYTIVIQDDIDIQIEESSVTLIPETSDVIGVIPTYSEMNIKPDKNTTLQMIMGDQKPNSIADAPDTEIDVASEKLNFTVLPAESRIRAQSMDTKALITTNDVQAGIQADKSNINILAGSPLILVTTRNTTIQIGPDTGNHGNGNGNNGGETTTPNSVNGGGATMITSGGKREVIKGSNVTLQWHATATFGGLELQWSRDGRPVSTEQPNLQISLDHTRLHIINIQEEDEAVYTCIAKAPGGQATIDFQLVVIIPPSISGRLVEDITVIEGRSLTMSCEFSAKPAPKVSWIMNGKQLSERAQLLTLSDGTTVYVAATTEQDGGSYSCTVQNKAGKVEKTFNVRVRQLSRR